MAGFDLNAYLQRIEFSGRAVPDLKTLEQLHRLHPGAIPFENLDTMLGKRVLIDIETIQDKLVARRRGGYCYEHNTLLQAALAAIGFELLPLAARVVWNRDSGYQNPRTHMVLLVSVGTDRYLCDVGFGGANMTKPLRFEPGAELTTPHARFRLIEGDSDFAVEVLIQNRWRRAFEFDLQVQKPIDYEAMNHYVQSYPGSHFRSQLIVAIADATGRSALNNNSLGRFEDGTCIEQRSLLTAEALYDTLIDRFGISLPADRNVTALLERVAATPPK